MITCLQELQEALVQNIRQFGIRKFPKKLVISLLFCSFMLEINNLQTRVAMIVTDKVTEIFCILDEFCKNLNAELTKKTPYRPHRRGSISA